MRQKRRPYAPLDEALTRLAESHTALSQAQATLVANQAALLDQERRTAQEVAEIRKDMLELDRKSDGRVRRIESILERLVEVLPEAVREKIGLRTKKSGA